MRKNLEAYLHEKKLHFVEKISKGYSSEVFLVENRNGKKFALKLEKEKSPRVNMVQKEAENPKLANSCGIGPKLFDADDKRGIVLMEFIEGKTFSEWLFETNVSKHKLQSFLTYLFVQAEQLDKIGLDHGQLAGKGKNILVRNSKPVIIDFEKASHNRKCRNVNQLKSLIYLNPHSAIPKMVKEILG